VKRWIPDRGHAVWIDMDPQAGREQPGRRPAIILSPAEYNGKVGLALMCPITSQAKGYPFEVLLPVGSKISGAILSDQLKSLDWRGRRATMIFSLPGQVVDEVLSKLSTLLQPV